jgi:hypothetical protein
MPASDPDTGGYTSIGVWLSYNYLAVVLKTQLEMTIRKQISLASFLRGNARWRDGHSNAEAILAKEGDSQKSCIKPLSRRTRIQQRA